MAGAAPTGFGPSDLQARPAQRSGNFGLMSGHGNASGGSELYAGTGAGGGHGLDTMTTGGILSSDDGYHLNFEATDIAAVCKAVLGDVLAVNYTIDPRVSGQITLSSSRPVPKASLLRLLESTLKGAGVAVVKDGALYRVVPAPEGVGAGATEFGRASEGFGVTVIPVKFVSVSTLAKLMENFVTRAGAIRPDPASGLILVMGTAQERQAALEAASVIDTDLMRQQSVGIFPLKNASPANVIAEMGKIMGSGEGGRAQGQIQFQPMERMNAVLVIARSREGLEAASTWVRRLDRNDPAAAGVKVYRLRYAPAKAVASMLNDAFSGQGGGVSQSDTSALQPNTGTVAVAAAAAATTATSTVDPARFGSGSQFGESLGAEATSLSLAAGAEAAASSGGGGGSRSGGVRVTPDTLHNSLLIFADAQQYRLVEAAIRQLDRPPEQVAIEATVAEVALTDKLQYGVQVYLENSKIGGSGGSFGFSTIASAALTGAGVPGTNFILGSALNPRVILNALDAQTHVRILSSPSLVVLNNQIASLQVGNQVAVKTQSAQSTESSTAAVVNNITYKDTGIILRVQPRIGDNGIINLEIEQEISNVVDNTGGTDGLTPTISQRRVKSSIVVPNGQTVMLAGLIGESTSHGRSGLPGSSRMGWLGDIIGKTDKTAARNEFVIFIKPQIMRDQADAQGVAQEFRAKLTAMGQLYAPQAPLVTK